MLAGGSAALRDAADEARRLGIILDEDTLRNAERVNDELTAVSAVLNAKFQKALLDLMPVISGVAGWIMTTAENVAWLTKELGWLMKKWEVEVVDILDSPEPPSSDPE